jgi:hypothetical protein
MSQPENVANDTLNTLVKMREDLRTLREQMREFREETRVSFDRLDAKFDHLDRRLDELTPATLREIPDADADEKRFLSFMDRARA